MIETVGRDSLIVRGVTVSIDNRTQFLGDPPMVGRLADVQAIQFADGRLMARAIYTWPPTPTPHDHTDAQTHTDTVTIAEPNRHIHVDALSAAASEQHTDRDTAAQLHAAAHSDPHADSDSHTDGPGRSSVYTQAIAAFPKWTNQK